MISVPRCRRHLGSNLKLLFCNSIVRNRIITLSFQPYSMRFFFILGFQVGCCFRTNISKCNDPPRCPLLLANTPFYGSCIFVPWWLCCWRVRIYFDCNTNWYLIATHHIYHHCYNEYLFKLFIFWMVWSILEECQGLQPDYLIVKIYKYQFESPTWDP